MSDVDEALGECANSARLLLPGVRAAAHACLSRLDQLRAPIAVVTLALGAIVAVIPMSGRTDTKPEGTSIDSDAFSYLENDKDERTLAWVRKENQRTLALLKGDHRYTRYHQLALEAENVARDLGRLDNRVLSINDGWIYQYLLNTEHPRGLWRRSKLSSFLSDQPVWQLLLDLDALSSREGRTWILAVAHFSPGGRRCLLQLSDGSSQTFSFREFDLEHGEFSRNGFEFSSYLGRAVWKSDDSLLVNADFGPGSLNGARAPIVVKEWRRGQPLSEAREIFRGSQDDIMVSVIPPYLSSESEPEYGSRSATIAQWDQSGAQTYWQVDGAGRIRRMTVPEQTWPDRCGDHYVVPTRRDWTIGGRTWKAGSLLSIPASDVTLPAPRVYEVMELGSDRALEYYTCTRGGLLLFGASVANGRLWKATFGESSWTLQPVPMPDHGVIRASVSSARSGHAFVVYQDFLQPASLYGVDLSANSVAVVKQTAAAFDSNDYVTEQLEAKSADGALVPYFVVRHRKLPLDGSAPTLLYGYGALGGSLSPNYDGARGKLWLEQGGVYVEANIRGGMERGSSWWVTGANRQRVYEDMIAVAEDVVRRKFSSPKRMAMRGHSAGGLLAAVMMNQRPDLFGAVVIEAGALDNFRMDLTAEDPKLRWAEFGSPHIPVERAFLERTSPFHNLKRTPNAPMPFILTSTSDQTVLPANSRRFAAKMESLQMPFLFLETPDGGHGIAGSIDAKIELDALIYTYLARQLMH